MRHALRKIIIIYKINICSKTLKVGIKETIKFIVLVIVLSYIYFTICLYCEDIIVIPRIFANVDGYSLLLFIEFCHQKISIENKTRM